MTVLPLGAPGFVVVSVTVAVCLEVAAPADGAKTAHASAAAVSTLLLTLVKKAIPSSGCKSTHYRRANLR
jgi:hypothetical protein